MLHFRASQRVKETPSPSPHSLPKPFSENSNTLKSEDMHKQKNGCIYLKIFIVNKLIFFNY